MSRFRFAIGLLLLLYGSGSLLFTIRNMPVTGDERVYLLDGARLLKSEALSTFRDRIHPPLSKWVGVSGDRLLPVFIIDPIQRHRVMHAVLYLLVGVCLIWLVHGAAGGMAAPLLGGFLGFCPNLKAMASLNVTDSDSAMLAALAFTLLWVGDRALLAVVAAGLLALATCSKLSVFLFWPFFYILYFRRWPVGQRRLGLALALGAVLTGVVLGYGGDLRAAADLSSNIKALREYANQPHLSYLLGNHSWTGFWYFFLVSILLKTPLPTMAAIGLAVRPFLRNRGIRLAFGLPALAFMAVLSFGSGLHIGIRHILPAMLLIFVGASLALARSRIPWPVWLLAGGASLGVDLVTLRNSSYLSYANPLTPRPVTRALADSNMDWTQGLPAHVPAGRRAFAPLETHRLMDVLFDPSGRSQRFIAGATAIAGLWSGEAPGLKLFQPEEVIAGYEVHLLTPEKIFALVELWLDPGYDAYANSHYFEAKAREYVSACPAGARRKIRLLELPRSSKGKGDYRFELVPGRRYVAQAEPRGHFNLRVSGQDVVARKVDRVWGFGGSGEARFEVRAKNPEFKSVAPMKFTVAWRECQ